jgi:hypothetical protein
MIVIVDGTPTTDTVWTALADQWAPRLQARTITYGYQGQLYRYPMEYVVTSYQGFLWPAVVLSTRGGSVRIVALVDDRLVVVTVADHLVSPQPR